MLPLSRFDPIEPPTARHGPGPLSLLRAINRRIATSLQANFTNETIKEIAGNSGYVSVPEPRPYTATRFKSMFSSLTSNRKLFQEGSSPSMSRK